MAAQLSETLIQSLVERGYTHRGDVRFIRPDGTLCRMEPRTMHGGSMISWYVKDDWDLVFISRLRGEEPPVSAPQVPMAISA